MPVFTYRGVNRAGTTVTGERAAASKEELQSLLRREQIAEIRSFDFAGLTG